MKNISNILGILAPADIGAQYEDDLTHLCQSARRQSKTRTTWKVQSLVSDGVF